MLSLWLKETKESKENWQSISFVSYIFFEQWFYDH